MITNSAQNTRFRWQTAKKLESLAEEITDIKDGNVEFGKNIEVDGNVIVNGAENIVDKDGNPIVSGGGSGSGVASISINYDNGYIITAEQKKQIVKANYNCEISLINNESIIGVFLPVKTTGASVANKRHTVLFSGTLGSISSSYILSKCFDLQLYYDDNIDKNVDEVLKLNDGLSIKSSLYYVGYTGKLADGATVNIFVEMAATRDYATININNHGFIRNIWSIAYSSSTSAGEVQGPAILLSYSGTTAQFKVYNKAGELEEVTGTYFPRTSATDLASAYVIGLHGFN